jgi:hypothetical protein
MAIGSARLRVFLLREIEIVRQVACRVSSVRRARSCEVNRARTSLDSVSRVFAKAIGRIFVNDRIQYGVVPRPINAGLIRNEAPSCLERVIGYATRPWICRSCWLDVDLLDAVLGSQNVDVSLLGQSMIVQTARQVVVDVEAIVGVAIPVRSRDVAACSG